MKNALFGVVYIAIVKKTKECFLYKTKFYPCGYGRYGSITRSCNLTSHFQYEPRHEKTGLLHMRKQIRRSATGKLISAFVFATRIVQLKI